MAGPTLWMLSGPLVPDDGVLVAPGLHGVAGISVRAWRHVGWSLEGGGYTFPSMAPDLPAYLYAWDLRISLVAWFGPKSLGG
jgi:hypothetical protein